MARAAAREQEHDELAVLRRTLLGLVGYFDSVAADGMEQRNMTITAYLQAGGRATEVANVLGVTANRIYQLRDRGLDSLDEKAAQ